MSSRTSTTLLILAAAALPAAALAQPAGPPAGAPTPGAAPRGTAPQAAGRITGTVVHAASGQPVASAAVAVRSARDSSLVGGGYTRPDGTFRIDGLRPGSYTVRVRVIGFAPLVKAVVVTPAAPAAEVGKLALTPVAAELSSVTVTAQQEAVALAPDRNSYTVKDMPAASGGSAVDVLRNVPAVEVDGDNKVSLRGNENVVVQINGRMTPMRGEALGNFLAQLPANMVSKVEVVPNPSAKSDPEGMAGIVNIVLKENADLGLSGGATVGGGTTGQVNASGNVGYQAGKLTLFANYGFMRDDRAISGFTSRQGLATGLQPFLESDASGAFTPKSHSLNASADYKLAAKSTLSSNFMMSQRELTRENDNAYRELDAARALTGRSMRTSTQTGNGLMLDYTLGYKRTAKQPGDALSAEFRVNRSRDDDAIRLSDQALSTAGATSGAAAIETNATGALTHNWTLQTDYTRTLAPRTKLETGYKGTLRQMENAYDVAQWSDATGGFVSDAARSNAFDYDEQVHAAYAVLSRGVGKFDLQGGLRAEQVSTRFDLATTGTRYDNNYHSLYPSAIAAFNVDDRRQLKASYSKRVTRPDTRQLNPFGFREDALNVFQGNPSLKPEYTHAFELGYQQSFDKGTVQVTPFARHTVNAVRFIRTIDDAGVSTTTFQNVATSDSYGTDVNGSLRLGRVTGFGGVSAFKQVTDGSNLSTDVSNSAIGWSARANATVKLTKTLDAQGFLMYRAPMKAEQGRMSAMTMTNLALRQKLRGDAASVTLRVMDPFNTMKMGFVTDDGRFYQTSQRHFGARGMFLSFNYAFGQQPRIRQRAPEQQESSQPTPDGRIP
jgi:outer membrane receptor protein involved in Fe transport